MQTKNRINTIYIIDALYTFIEHASKIPFTHFVVIEPICNTKHIDLWHFRMGILLTKDCTLRKHIIHELPINNLFFILIIKIKRLSFPLSTSQTSSPFDLLHIDI